MATLGRIARAAIAAGLLVLAACSTRQSAPLAGAEAPDPRQMVATAHPLATEAGLDILRAGGGAIDAAVAAHMVLTLVEPQSSGIGGGGFLLHYDGAGGVSAYDGRETAPAAAGPDMFLRPDGMPMAFYEAAVGGLAVGVPGTVRMLALAHRRHGRLPWARLFLPAIRLAEEGFPVSARLARQIADDEHLRRFPATAAYFYPGGKSLSAGARLRNPVLAATLRAVAADPDAFYRGPIAADIVAAVQSATGNPGRLAAVDMAGYRAVERAALCRPYRRWTVCGMPPPSSGGIAVLQILGLLQGFDMAAQGPGSVEAVHLIAEASRLAFADRNRYVADADFVPVPVEGLLRQDYLAARARAISPARRMDEALPGTPVGALSGAAPAPAAEPPSTSHLAVVDAEGEAVSFTASIESAFGARLMVGGFLLNNQLTDFAFRPAADGRAVANRVEPGKRPRSSMSPTLVLDERGRLRLAIGSPGGANIIGYVAKTLIGVLDWGLAVDAAIALPNFVNRGGVTELEAGTPLESIAAPLRKLGHEVELVALTSGLQGIEATLDGRLVGGADPRREGVALGGAAAAAPRRLRARELFVRVRRPAEGCRSGRSGRSRKPLYPRGYRGFESHPLRHSRRRGTGIQHSLREAGAVLFKGWGRRPPRPSATA